MMAQFINANMHQQALSQRGRVSYWLHLGLFSLSSKTSTATYREVSKPRDLGLTNVSLQNLKDIFMLSTFGPKYILALLRSLSILDLMDIGLQYLIFNFKTYTELSFSCIFGKTHPGFL